MHQIYIYMSKVLISPTSNAWNTTWEWPYTACFLFQSKRKNLLLCALKVGYRKLSILWSWPCIQSSNSPGINNCIPNTSRLFFSDTYRGQFIFLNKALMEIPDKAPRGMFIIPIYIAVLQSLVCVSPTICFQSWMTKHWIYFHFAWLPLELYYSINGRSREVKT